MAYEVKTKKNKELTIPAYIRGIEDSNRRRDAKIVHKIMQDISGGKGRMWGKSIAGYGEYHYKGKSSEGDWMATGWSSRAQNLTIYIMPGYRFDEMKELLKKLGPHKLGRSCLYIKRLDDIHLPTLKKMIKDGLTYMKKNYDTKRLK
jgi:hypothetical protein